MSDLNLPRFLCSLYERDVETDKLKFFDSCVITAPDASSVRVYLQRDYPFEGNLWVELAALEPLPGFELRPKKQNNRQESS